MYYPVIFLYLIWKFLNSHDYNLVCLTVVLLFRVKSHYVIMYLCYSQSLYKCGFQYSKNTVLLLNIQIIMKYKQLLLLEGKCTSMSPHPKMTVSKSQYVVVQVETKQIRCLTYLWYLILIWHSQFPNGLLKGSKGKEWFTYGRTTFSRDFTLRRTGNPDPYVIKFV